MEKQKDSPNISSTYSKAVAEQYELPLPDGKSVICRSYEPAQGQKLEDGGIVMMATGFGADLDFQTPAVSYLADLCGEKVITAETTIGDREPQKIEKFLEVTKDAISKNPGQKVSFVLQSEGGNYGSKAILKLIKEAPELIESIGAVVFVGSAGLMGEDSTARVSGRFILDSFHPHYTIGDLKQSMAYMKGLTPDLWKNRKTIFKTIGDIADSDTRRVLSDLRERGVFCSLISSHSDTAFPVERLQLGKDETVHDQEFIDRESKHSSFYFMTRPVEAVADILTSHNHPEVWDARARTRAEAQKMAKAEEQMQAWRKKRCHALGYRVVSGQLKK